MKYPFPVPSPNPDPNCNTKSTMNNFGRPCTQFRLMYTTPLYISQEFNNEFHVTSMVAHMTNMIAHMTNMIAHLISMVAHVTSIVAHVTDSLNLIIIPRF